MELFQKIHALTGIEYLYADDPLSDAEEVVELTTESLASLPKDLIDPMRERLDCVVDLNPNKQGGFVPGTGHAIVDFRGLPGRNVKSAILMNPNYLAENAALLREAGIAIDLIGNELP